MNDKGLRTTLVSPGVQPIIFRALSRLITAIQRLTRPSAGWNLPNSDTSLTIVSAADKSHFVPLVQLLVSIQRFEPNARVHIWDLGLTILQCEVLQSCFTGLQMRKFDFDSKPSFIRIENDTGSYAWKPLIVQEESEDDSGFLIWLDAGDRLVSSLSPITRLLKSRPFYSPYSSGTLSNWTHQDMLKRFDLTYDSSHLRNLNGAIIAFDTREQPARVLINEWSRCALDKECIAPNGSDRTNHRQDQSALSCIAYRMMLVKPGIQQRITAGACLQIHQDELIDQATITLLRNAGYSEP